MDLLEKARKIVREKNLIDTEYKTKGYADLPAAIVIESKVLDDEWIVIKRDRSVRIPREYNLLVCYTYQEAETLLGMGSELIRKVHIIKEAFNGTIKQEQ